MSKKSNALGKWFWFVSIFEQGRVVEMGPTDRIIEGPLHPYTKALLSAVPLPDPEQSRPRVRLPGEVPSPPNLPPGCVFHPRCPEVFSACSASEPHLLEEKPGHLVSCHLYAENHRDK